MPVAERQGRQGRGRLVPTFSLTPHCLLIPKSARGLAHSKTLREIEKGLEHASAFGVRQSSAAIHSGPCD